MQDWSDAEPTQLIITTFLLAAAAQPPVPPRVQLAQVVVRERVVIRIPMRRPARQAPVSYRERKGPPCLSASDIAGAAVTNGDTVDFILRGGARIRARFEDACPALDFYSGFYLKPNADGRICQGRDPIHSRAGGECRITRFRLLEPRPPK